MPAGNLGTSGGSSHLALISVWVHLIRADERIAAGSVILIGARSVSLPVRTAAIDSQIAM